jgi:hypothetical protein
VNPVLPATLHATVHASVSHAIGRGGKAVAGIGRVVFGDPPEVLKGMNVER